MSEIKQKSHEQLEFVGKVSKVADEIRGLSATSKEGLRITENSVQILNEYNDIINKIYELTNKIMIL
ncbi:hypothetical protein ACTNDG_07405 [Clostridium sp. HCP1S3_B4]|uniref:hypothetical protein n=1 Tax=unclassified Clostridium TaxID=2614128 RepID=UPI003F8890BE